MNSNNLTQSEIKGLMRHQRKQGGVAPSHLLDGTKVLVETGNFVYEIIADDGYGQRKFLVRTGSPICAGHNYATKITSHCSRLKYNINDWIGKGMRMMLEFTSGVKIMTSEVQTAIIIGTDKDGNKFKYDLWT